MWHLTTREAASPAEAESSPTTEGSRSLPSLSDQGSPRADPTPAPAEPIAAQVSRLMENWRAAIIKKDAEAVETLDRTFAAYPKEFIPALMAMAQGDSEDRVRSFCTRVLGKLRPPESAELMRKLLADRSEHVRFNAAWAIGELSDSEAAPRLRQLQKRDPSPEVRRSAEASLRKIGGG